MSDEKILHQDDVEEVIYDEVEEGVGKDNPAIDDVADDVDDVGAVYSQAEVNAIVAATNANGTAINSILAALRANGIIDESEG